MLDHSVCKSASSIHFAAIRVNRKKVPRFLPVVPSNQDRFQVRRQAVTCDRPSHLQPEPISPSFNCMIGI